MDEKHTVIKISLEPGQFQIELYAGKEAKSGPALVGRSTAFEVRALPDQVDIEKAAVGLYRRLLQQLKHKDFARAFTLE